VIFAMGRANLLYTQDINSTHGRGGHLWQKRHFSCPLDPGYFLMALCCIEQNPVRAKPSKYRWMSRCSSQAERCVLCRQVVQRKKTTKVTDKPMRQNEVGTDS